MQVTFVVSQVSTDSLLQLPGDWTTDDFREILSLTEYGDQSELSDKEIQEMAYMSLADLPKAEAADLLLSYVFPEGTLTKGQRQNSSHEMDTERLWEEYPEPEHHAGFYRVGSLLYAAFNGGHPKPDGRQLVIRVSTKQDAADLLTNPDPALVLRLLAPAMDGHALLHRLYEDELKGGSFPTAKHILYRMESRPLEDDAFELTVYSTDYWLEDFRPVETYEATVAIERVEAVE
ncbi:hypothetical protein [Lewinella sp. IMCC34191]|uniref:hypothetical protein n=1 Tax=Lewinella sp. IMCC34191 TaxID=2259172 RepID=UPI000E252C4D|nr:hypothetical protein [Lewinella sp. IMCC34191]